MTHIEVFDGKGSPPGFASVVLLDESHISAHMYSVRNQTRAAR
jgi:S-adenosylmethionine/arginine decarboxylase-like enzyme